MGIIIKSAVLTPAVVDTLTNYIISIGVISTANYVYIKYSDYATPTDAQMLDTPAAYMGVCVTDEETAPTTAVSYKWNLVRGPNEVSTATGTNITGLLKGNGTNVAGAVDGTDYISPSGGTLTGVLTLSGDPSAALSAATKRYVDNSAVTLVELARYTSSGTFSPADYPSVDNRYLILLVGGGSSGGSGYAAGAVQFVDFLWLPTLMPRSFTAIVAAVNGTTKFVADASGGAFLAPGSTHTGSTGTVSPGSTGSYTGAGSSSGAVSSIIPNYGGSGKPGIVIIFGYRKVGDIA